jgi:DNA-binding transcriptional regulator GbsR (MarR family)
VVKAMADIYLQRMVEDIPDDGLPEAWSNFDLSYFSHEKTLFDYQQQALKNALKALWKYYGDFDDYQIGEDEQVNRGRKQKLWQWYLDNGLREDISIEPKPAFASLLREYYLDYLDNRGRISYEAFINRMSFWMATGSGKTLVIVKLIEILARLIQLQEVPPCDILFLTHRDDLIEQLRRHVKEFNASHSDLSIILRELKDYAVVKREWRSLFQEQEIIVFYYRSDNLSDEQKEKIVDFRNYDNNGRWFIFLDEAHKGDKEESKRQHIYSILSRNGFLFNFSATFTDPRDIATTVFNFNLSEYIRRGYGKHLLVLKQEMRAFREKEDYSDAEKRKVVLKALLLLTYVRKVYEEKVLPVKSGIYHRPLMLVLANSVNTEDADLEMFFRELERIAREGIDDATWQEVKEEVRRELGQSLTFLFDNEVVKIDSTVWDSLSQADLYQYVFNADVCGEIEVLLHPSNRQEMAFKLKSSNRPFALIKIGDISSWLKEKLGGYEIGERFEEESFFARLNAEDSDINILMGSRTFYEGWDSNRPNVICYINIGVGTDAQKFILQSVGRGVRIEPIENRRRRLIHLHNAGEIDGALFNRLKNIVQPLETLFIFGTNRRALLEVIENLQQAQTITRETKIDLFEVNPETQCRPLLIPVYRRADKPLADHVKFEIDEEEFEVLQSFIKNTEDRVILLLTEAKPKLIATLRHTFERNDSFKFNERRYGNLIRLLHRVLKYLDVVPEEVDRLKRLEGEIRHFKHITVTLQDITELEDKIKRVKEYRYLSSERDKLIDQLQRGEITPEDFKKAYDRTTQIVKEERFEHNGKRIRIKHIVQHYYLPVVLSDSERIDYIRHIIKTPSEMNFILDLEKSLSRPDSMFNQFDWWFFSKLDASLDEVYIPYYDRERNRIAQFKPDFIFWLKKGQNYWIVFIDPKSRTYTDYEWKVDDFRKLFEENGHPKNFDYNGLKVKVGLFLETDDRNRVADAYRSYWIDSPEDIARWCLSNSG